MTTAKNSPNDKIKAILDNTFLPNEIIVNVIAADDFFIPSLDNSSKLYKIFANIPNGSITLPPHSTICINCGFNLTNFNVTINSLPSFLEKGLFVSPYVIDGEVNVYAVNTGDTELIINHKDCIALGNFYQQPLIGFVNSFKE